MGALRGWTIDDYPRLKRYITPLPIDYAQIPNTKNDACAPQKSIMHEHRRSFVDDSPQLQLPKRVTVLLPGVQSRFDQPSKQYFVLSAVRRDLGSSSSSHTAVAALVEVLFWESRLSVYA